MGATTLPAPLEAAAREPLAPPAARRPARRRDRLERKLHFAVAGVSLPLVALSGLGVAGLQGPWAWLAGGVGLAGLGVVAAATRWLARAVVVPTVKASDAARAMGSGDLTRPIVAADGAELRPMLEALEEVRRGLVRLVAEVRAGTTHVAMNSSQITRDNEALWQRTGTQAESVQRTAATMEELTAAIRHNAENTRQANALVHSAAQRAEHGGAVMGEVVRVMDSIRDSSQSIRDIIAVIDGIAFQTNILALNAAVEAARAGEHGRGFAVVAGEVRTLSQRCAASAREVKELVGRSVEQVESAGPRVDEAGRAMAEIVAAVRQAAELIAHIDASGREQSAGIESLNEAIARIDQVTQDNFALVQDAGRTAASLHQRAVTLLKGTSAFDLGAREQGSREEAVELVRQAAEFCRTHGRDALVADVNRLAEGRFVDRDLYLMVIDFHHIILAHGNNPRTVGGPVQVREMVTVARAQGEGWVSYKWNHPVTNEVLTKTTFVRRVGDVVVACGVYAGAGA